MRMNCYPSRSRLQLLSLATQVCQTVNSSDVVVTDILSDENTGRPKHLYRPDWAPGAPQLWGTTLCSVLPSIIEANWVC